LAEFEKLILPFPAYGKTTLTMMDLEEAQASLDFYANSLELLCVRYGLAVTVGGFSQPSSQTQPKIAGQMDKTLADLKRSQHECVVFNIVVEEAIGSEAGQLVQHPLEFSKLLRAKTRNTLALNKVSSLLDEHDRQQASKDAPLAKENSVSAAIQRFKDNMYRKEAPT
jgi:hypothetical protein